MQQRTKLFQNGESIEGKSCVLASSSKGFDGFFAKLEQLKLEAAAKQIAKQQ